jgi:hypothetical protein
MRGGLKKICDFPKNNRGIILDRNEKIIPLQRQ